MLASPRPFGLPWKPGVHVLGGADWVLIFDFIKSRVWYHDTPVCEVRAMLVVPWPFPRPLNFFFFFFFFF